MYNLILSGCQCQCLFLTVSNIVQLHVISCQYIMLDLSWGSATFDRILLLSIEQLCSSSKGQSQIILSRRGNTKLKVILTSNPGPRGVFFSCLYLYILTVLGSRLKLILHYVTNFITR